MIRFKKLRKMFFYLGIAALAFVGGLYFSRNLIMSSLLEKSAEALFSAKAEMKGCDLQVFSGKLLWEDFSVADKNKPMQNLFQTGYVELDFELSSLLEGKIVCTNLILAKLRFASKRDKSGALPERIVEEEKQSKIAKFALDYLQRQKNSIPILTYEKMNVDSVLASCQLITPGKVDSLEDAMNEIKASWGKLLEDKNFAQRAEKIKEKFNSIDFKNTASSLKELEQLYKEGNQLYEDSEEQRQEFEEKYGVLKTANQLNEWVKQDYNKVMQAVKFPDSQGYKMGEVLFGSAVYDIILQVINLVKTSRNSLDATKPESEQKLRFWLKRINFNSKLTNGDWIKGEITNVSNAQKIVKKPIEINLSLLTSKNEVVEILGKLNYQNEKPSESLQIDLKSIRVANMKLNQDALPPKIDSCLLNGKIKFQAMGEDILLKSNLKFSEIVYSYEYEKDVSKQMKEIARLVGNSASAVWVEVDFASSKSGVETSIKSSLDEVVKKALYKKFSSEKKELQAKLSKKIGKGKHKKKLDLVFKAFDQEVASILLDESPISDEQKEGKKNIADKILDEGKKILEENSDLKDKAKDLFKGLKF